MMTFMLLLYLKMASRMFCVSGSEKGAVPPYVSEHGLVLVPYPKDIQLIPLIN